MFPPQSSPAPIVPRGGARMPTSRAGTTVGRTVMPSLGQRVPAKWTGRRPPSSRRPRSVSAFHFVDVAAALLVAAHQSVDRHGARGRGAAVGGTRSQMLVGEQELLRRVVL